MNLVENSMEVVSLAMENLILFRLYISSNSSLIVLVVIQVLFPIASQVIESQVPIAWTASSLCQSPTQ